MKLTTTGDGFLRDGRPHRIVSAAIHYFRVHPQLWRDRLERLRAMGVNTVETYVAWNVHERERGRFDFSGWNDVAGFVALAGELGLDVIVRPGPYICAEWESGGLPAWLLTEPGLRLRRSEPVYLAAVDAWFDALLPRLTPLLAEAGGPIVAMAVENEYGSYGNDAGYLRHLHDGLLRRGVTCLLFTADGAEDWFQLGGRIPGVLATGTFGSRPQEALACLRRHQPSGPLVCMEYWHAWFDSWGEPHRVREAAESARVLDELLAAGASVNLYMGHGGTNFGWWNGANCYDGRYLPIATSYDYDAPVGEGGELSPKFHAFREVIERHTGPVAHPVPPAPSRLAPRRIGRRTGRAALFDCLDLLGEPVERLEPEPMEALGQSTGLILYRTRLRGPLDKVELRVDGLADRAQVFLDGQELGTLHRNEPLGAVPLGVPAAGARLDLLVESQGRVNYGPDTADRKGITGGVLLERQYQFGWEIRPLPLDLLPELPFAASPSDASGADAVDTVDAVDAVDAVGAVGADAVEAASADASDAAGPSFHRFELDLGEEPPADGFLALPGWTKGMVWLNGFALGRYWEVGPQRTLYAPAPLWRAGRNEITVLELHGPGRWLELCDAADLGPTDPAPEGF